ncbi:hypothetical protein ATI61_103385 [Archangium gephyra]|uniref:Uncharacterized protein n=1 Tax=Archangium gephyra TaxID=48 RepID=A0ABX9K6W8_9BACT|nr:hypothetical protein [Archangium gephyra]REG34485.1 hypothetical protein ATI61_103385 [Archangium gephyra]
MNRLYVVAWMLVLMLDTACPVGGDAGVLHQALLRDSIKKLAGASCQPADIWKECGPIQEDYDACKAACEEEMARRSRE